MGLFKEVEESPLDIGAVVARRRKDFTDEFFQHLNVLVDAYSSLDRRDGESFFLTIFSFNMYF
jgi:hypothetical protein